MEYMTKQTPPRRSLYAPVAKPTPKPPAPKRERKAAAVAAVSEIESKTVPVRLRVTPELSFRIDRVAVAEGVSRSEVIRRALEETF